MTYKIKYNDMLYEYNDMNIFLKCLFMIMPWKICIILCKKICINTFHRTQNNQSSIILCNI